MFVMNEYMLYIKIGISVFLLGMFVILFVIITSLCRAGLLRVLQMLLVFCSVLWLGSIFAMPIFLAQVCWGLLQLMPVVTVILCYREIKLAFFTVYNHLARIFGRDCVDNNYNANDIISIIERLRQATRGGLLIFDDAQQIPDYIIEQGIPFHTKLDPDILVCILSSSYSFHDGAVIIRKNEIKAINVILPLNMDRVVRETRMGARHVVGLDVSEYSGVMALILSEEGVVSLAWDGMISSGVSIYALKEIIIKRLNIPV